MGSESPPAASLAGFGPVATERVSDLIADRLATAIRSGELKPGDRLPTEQELAEAFRVGRTSVREGLQKLRAHGLIESRKGLGAFVSTAPPDPLGEFARWTASNPRGIEELVEARFALESLAATLAVLRATPEELTEIELHHNEHRRAAEREELAAIVSTDEAFHSAVMTAAHNHFLNRMYDLLIGELTDFRRKTLALPWAGVRSAAGHERIVEAIRRRDPTSAKQAMIDHLFVLYREVHDSADGGGPDFPLLSRDTLI